MSLIEYYKKHHQLESEIEPQETPGTNDKFSQKLGTEVSSESGSDNEEVGMSQVWPQTQFFFSFLFVQ